MGRARPPHAALYLVQDEQRTMPVADLSHRREITRHRGHAARRRAHHRLGHEGNDRLRADTLKLGLQLGGKAGDVVGVTLGRRLKMLGKAWRDVTESLRQDRLVGRAPGDVTADGHRAEIVAVIALAARDEMRSLRLAELDVILPGHLERRFHRFGTG